MDERSIVSTRCDGQKIEILLFDAERLLIKEISPERALRMAHQLTGHALQMLDKREREG